mgnify:CR=1 FL=1
MIHNYLAPNHNPATVTSADIRALQYATESVLNDDIQKLK